MVLLHTETDREYNILLYAVEQPSVPCHSDTPDIDVTTSQTGRPIDTSGEEFPPPTSQSATVAPCALDIGILSKSGDLHSLPQHKKLELLNHTPDASYKYPTKYMHGCNRRFKPEWHKNHPWLHYSPSEDGVYCKACALFAPSDIRRQKLGTLVSKPFSLWTKQSSMFLSHEQNQYHQDSMTRMMAFKDLFCSNSYNFFHAQQGARGANYSQYQGNKVTFGVCLLLCKARSSFSGSQG